jgi:Tripartite tricarboxylate transporter TctB family
VRARDNRDFWAGLMLMGAGAAALVLARGYPIGTVLSMGPGYFPRVLGGILVLFGLYVAITGLRRGGKIPAGWSPRALVVIPLAMVLFGVLVERAGFVPALVVLVVGSAAAGREFRLGEVALLTALLTALSVAVFIWGLGLPYQLFKGF